MCMSNEPEGATLTGFETVLVTSKVCDNLMSQKCHVSLTRSWSWSTGSLSLVPMLPRQGPTARGGRLFSIALGPDGPGYCRCLPTQT